MTDSGKKELRKFGLTIGIALVVLGGLLFWLGKSSYPYFVLLGSVFILLGFIKPVSLKLIQRFWMKIGEVLGWCMTRVILSVLFFGVLTPISFTAKLFGKSFLDLKVDKTQHSYWIFREPRVFEKTDYERQF